MASYFNKIIHEPMRLKIMMILSGAVQVDFNFLLSTLQITRGNLSSHMNRLEKAGYVKIEKGFQAKKPHTIYQLTGAGKKAIKLYWEQLDEIKNLKA